ncbi:MAG TPA: Hsp20/alpha crystallin family protein [Actinomycetota bacterium]|nr:Hsp20/alpha crystallin family protein [Actinomycetota bacterium]
MESTIARRWDPLQDLFQVGSEVSRLLGTAESAMKGAWSPAVDILETPEKFQIVVELPGIANGEVDITVENDVLTLKGERRFNEATNQEAYRRIERHYGPFGRRIALPPKCDSTRINATMLNGLLTIDVPKMEQAKPQRIEVKAAE